MNNQLDLSIAGVWNPVDERYLTKDISGVVISSSSLVRLDSSGRFGIVFNGWGWQGSFGGNSSVLPINVALFAPTADGSQKISTDSYLVEATTNGGFATVVADYNGDGYDDIFFAAHNESPFVAKSSTVYLSDAAGKFKKITLSDSVMAHDAQLAFINGKPAVVATTYSPGDSHSIYQYENGAFVQRKMSNDYLINGMSSDLGAFSADGSLSLVRGDVMSGYNSATGDFSSSLINVYKFENFNISPTQLTQTITPFLSTLPQYNKFVSEWGVGITHTYRVWVDDLNHDGFDDLLAGQSMWNSSSNNWPSALQVLINNESGKLVDKTSALNPITTYDLSEFDYSPSFVDLDGSGIDTYLFSSLSHYSLDRQSNYVMLNDGTGKLYIAMHEQFEEILPQVFSYAESQFPGWVFDKGTFPEFIGVPQPDGSLNFVVQLNAGQWLDSDKTVWNTDVILVNVPFKYNPTFDFKENIEITDRNNSNLMRTWAGNDVFTDSNANLAPAHIDGGLGVDTSRYSGLSSLYQVENQFGGEVIVKGNGIVDKLKNVERLVFADKNIAIDLDGSAGNTVRILNAMGGREAVSKKDWVTAGLEFFDSGLTMDQVAEVLVNAGIVRQFVGSDSTDSFLSMLYRNVVGQEADTATVASLRVFISDNNMDQAKMLAFAAQTEINGLTIDLVGLQQTGVEYA